MPDIKNVFASEIRRLAKKGVKVALQPFQAQISKLRKTISEQNAKIKTLEKRVPTALPQKKEITPVAENKTVRMSPQWIIKLRQKLGLTQGQFAILLGTSNFSVSHWELGKTTPRDAFKRKIAALRGIGKRELKRLLEENGKDKAVKTTVKPKAKKVAVKVTTPIKFQGKPATAKAASSKPAKVQAAQKKTVPATSAKAATPISKQDSVSGVKPAPKTVIAKKTK